MSRREITGRRNTKYGKSTNIRSLLTLFCLQEVLAKYQESKKELDELVTSMEGL